MDKKGSESNKLNSRFLSTNFHKKGLTKLLSPISTKNSSHFTSFSSKDFSFFKNPNTNNKAEVLKTENDKEFVFKFLVNNYSPNQFYSGLMSNYKDKKNGYFLNKHHSIPTTIRSS